MFMILFLGSFLFSTLTHLSPYVEAFGTGAKTLSMGGAGTAILKEASAVYYNPASLSQCTVNRLAIGLNQAQTQFATSATPTLNHLGSYTGASLGACFKLPYGFSLGAYYQSAALSPINLEINTLTDTPKMALFGKELDFPGVALGASYAVLSNLSLGISAYMVANNNVTQGLDVPDPFLRIHARIVPSAALGFGLDYTPFSFWRLGAFVRTPVENRFHIDSQVTLHLMSQEFASDMDISGLVSYTPWQVVLGNAFKPIPKLTLALDLVWQKWSDYSGPFLKITPTSALSEDLQIHSMDEEFQFEFADLIYPKIGAEYAILESVYLRAGYFYRPAVLKPTLLKANLLDNGIHHMSVGLGYEIPYFEWLNAAFDLFASLDVMPSKTVEKPNQKAPYDRFDYGGYAFNVGGVLSLDF